MKTIVTRLFISAAATAIAASALAQQATPASTGEAEQAVATTQLPPGSAAQPATPAQEPADIVVTAQKSSESIARAPVAVTVVAQAALNRQGITSAEQLVSTAPTLSLSANGFAIRGIGSNNGFSGYSTVATQFDGIYNPSSAALGLALFDLASVEVLRGPQGTVYGRNATAGVVNVNTADPGNALGASASLQYGRFNDIRTQAAVDIPVTDTFAVRLSGFHQVNDGYGPQYLGDRFDRTDLLGARIVAKWKIAPNLTWRVLGSFGSNRGTTQAVYLRSVNYYPQANLATGSFGPVTIIPTDQINPGLDDVTDNRRDLQSYDMRSRLVWQATPELSLTYLAGYAVIRNNGVVATTGVFSQEYLDQKTRTWSNELDVNYEHGPLKLIAGAYQYADEQPSGQRLIHAGNTAPAPFNSLYNLFGATYAGTGTQISTTNAVDVVNTYKGTGSRSHALFGQATLTPFEHLRIIGGVRSTWDTAISRELQLVCAGGTVTRLNISSTTCPVGSAFAFTDDSDRPGAKFSKVSWKGGVDFDITDTLLGYATVSTGYRSGGLQASTNPVAYRQYKPETVMNIEGGLRANLLDHRLFVGLTAYQMNYRDLQVSTIVVDPLLGPTAVTANAAKARIRGVELETSFRPTTRDRISGYVSVLDAKFLSFPDAPDNLHSADTFYNIYAAILGLATIPSTTMDASGNRLPNAPRFSARASYSHVFPLASGAKITPSVDFFAQTHSFATADNAPQGRIGGYTKTDLNLQYDAPGGHYYAALFVNNVENRRIPTTVSPVWSSTTVSYALPRLYGVRVGFTY